MDELLAEMQKAAPDEDKINSLARELFITHEGKLNRPQVNEFEKYAPCKIYPIEQDSSGWLIGGIFYNFKTFTFG